MGESRGFADSIKMMDEFLDETTYNEFYEDLKELTGEDQAKFMMEMN